MKTSSLFWARSVSLLAAVLLASSCGSGDSAATAQIGAEATIENESAADTTTAPEQAAEEATPVAVEPDSGSKQIEISGGPSGPWSTVGKCSWTPDNTGPASILWLVETFEDNDLPGELHLLYVWPFVVENDTVPALIGTILEPDGSLLTVIDADASFDDSTVTVVASVHDGIKTFDDAADFVVTITCSV